jgi:hypothetical protein
VIPSTLHAFADHGEVARTLDADPAAAKRTLQQAAAAKIDLASVTAELEGGQIVRDSYRELTGK